MMKELIKSYEKQSKYYLVMFLSLAVIIIGMASNFYVMDHNDRKMPVYSAYCYFDEDHFTFNSFDEIKYPYLSDIIDLRFGDNYYLASIGDVLMALGLMAILSSVIMIIITKVEIKRVKNGNKRN